MTSIRTPRPLDHCVLPVGDLETARSRLSALGFTVAPDGQHPFGTENCCVYFADNTFLEPLAIGQRETAEASILTGNAFVARDAAYRFRRGPEGFSALVMGSADAAADHARFIECAISGGKMLSFSRPFLTPDGAKDKASFRLAFAADLRAPDIFFFTCERVNVPKSDRSALQRHANGAIAIREIVMSEPNPTDFQYLLQEVLNQRDVNAHSFGMTMESANATISVLNEAGMQAFFGVKAVLHARGLRLRAIVVTVTDLPVLEEQFASRGIGCERHGSRILVHPAAGQGCILAFEAAQ